MKLTLRKKRDKLYGLGSSMLRNYFSRSAIFLLSLFCTFSITTSSGLANPAGGEVVTGKVVITTPVSNTVQINQSSDKAIINWQSFNIGAGEKTQFVQPNGNSVALNRINPSLGASQIFGNLTANGQIILINQAGIYFASGAQVNVGSIIASTIDMTNQNFLAGKYMFDQPSQYFGSIINKGTIIASQNGLVALVGAGVSNEGLIRADLGSVILASGSKFTFTFSGSQLISFIIDGEAMSAGVDQNGKALKNGVNNSGKIIANGGKILITAKTVSNTLDNAINMSGVAQAQSVSEKNGEIILSADSGIVRVAAILDVSGKIASEKGGKVKIVGPSILIEAPTIIDASGNTGGGEILIGGNLHGAGPEVNALNTTISAGALIAANALQKGNGGKIIVWANDVTNYAGQIFATGGVKGGDGGFAEVSGKRLLSFRGTINLGATAGSIGILLLDPENLTIQSTDITTATIVGNTYTSNIDSSILTVADLQAALANANVLVQTGVGGLQAGDITVANNVMWNNLNTLTLSAFRNIHLNATITNSSGGNLILKADNTGVGTGGIIFSGITPQITMSGGGVVNFYYNPSSFPIPNNFSSNVSVNGGTTFIPYMLVNNLTSLQNMNNNLSGNYALGRDIDASATSGWNAGAGFVPVGISAASFTGRFDGQNHIVDRLTIFLPLADSVGMFGYVNSSGIIQNVGLTNMTITGLTHVGGLIGYDAAGAVNNAYSTGSVTSDAISSYVGGLIGFSGSNVSNSFSSATVFAGAASNYIGGLIGQAGAGVSNSYHATGSVTAGAASTYVGGLIGYSLGSVSHAYNTGPVLIGATGSANFGGLIGYSAGDIYYSYNTGAITAGAAVTNVGGLIGYGAGTVNNSYSTGFITTGATGSSNIGGLVGFANNNVTNSYSNSSISGGAANNNVGGLVGQNNAIISNSYSTGNVASGAGSTFLGGLVGLNNAAVNNSFWDIQTSGQLASAGGAGKTTSEMMQQTTFCPAGSCASDRTHFDFVTNWGIVNGVTYPYLLAATLTYTANIASMIYGGTLPLFSGTITGFVGSETQATATMGNLLFTSSATSSSNVGSYAINGSGLTANNGNYIFVQEPGNATALTVTTAPLTITATNQSKTYGDTLALGSSAFTASGLQNSETVASVTLISAGAMASANVSSSPYAITPSAASGGTFTASNYSITYVDGVLTVNPATLSYTATTATLTYGSAVPSLSGTVIGFVNSETQASATTGTLAFLSSATSSSNVGSYAINGSGLTANNGNYIFVQEPGNATALTVTTAPLTITATNQSKTYGDTLALGSSAFTASGLQNSETVASVTLISAGAMASANVSSSPYAITPSAASGGTFTASNYSITYVDGVLTVNPATLSYTATTATLTYGSAVPSLSGTVIGFVNSETQASATTGTLAFLSSATSSSNVGSYAINGSGLTANNGNYIFVQEPGNATALTVTTVTPTPSIDPVNTIIPTITIAPLNTIIPTTTIAPPPVNNSTHLSSLFALIVNVIASEENRNNINVSNTTNSNISIINNMNTEEKIPNITFENTALDNVIRNLSINSSISENIIGFFSSTHIGSSGILYSSLQNEGIKKQNLISQSNNNSQYSMLSLVLVSVAILLSLPGLLYWLYGLIKRRNNVAEKLESIIYDQYEGVVFTNVRELENLLQKKLSINYLVTTHFIFTDKGWITEPSYIDAAYPRSNRSKVPI
jgi:filamentous hemagglutinin family protein